MVSARKDAWKLWQVLARSAVGSVGILAAVGSMFSETFDTKHGDNASQRWCGEPDMNLLQEGLHLSAIIADDLHNQKTTAPHENLVAEAETGVDGDAAPETQPQTVFASRVFLPVAMQHDNMANVTLVEGGGQAAEQGAASQTRLPSPRSEDMQSPSDRAARDPEATTARHYEMQSDDRETENERFVALIQGTYRALTNRIAGAAHILAGSLHKSVGADLWLSVIILCLLGFVVSVVAIIALTNRDLVDENIRDVKRQQNDGLLARGGDMRSTPFGDRGVDCSARPWLSNASSGPPSSWDPNVAPITRAINPGSGLAGVRPGLTSDSQLPTAASYLAWPASAQEEAFSCAPMDASRQPVNVPPPLCPALVLPVCEARFAVPMNALLSADPKGRGWPAFFCLSPVAACC